jgi:alkylhydroperoxidase family enzyme
MARISLIEEKDHPELAELIADIKKNRRGSLLNLYKLLLHSPDLARSWMAQNNAVRWKTELDGRLREIVIIRIGHLHAVDYVVRQHVLHLAVPEGLSLPECDALKDWERTTYFDPRERAALAYADAMTMQVAVPDAVFDALKPQFTERQILELTVLIGTYNMQTRVLKALAIDPERAS